MTDKIIIDGVDVSECEFYRKKTHNCNYDENKYRACLSTKCHYKMYKREEKSRDDILLQLNKEREEHNILLGKYSNDLNNAMQQLKRKEVECEKLRQELKQYNCSENFQNQCHCAFRCLGNEFCEDAENKINKLNSELQTEKEKVKELERNLKNSFEEITKLNVIIDRLLSHNGYNQCTTSAEDFEDIYQNMEYKREKFKEYKQALEEIKENATINYINTCWTVIKNCEKCPDKNKCQEQNPLTKLKVILQKCEVLDEKIN